MGRSLITWAGWNWHKSLQWGWLTILQWGWMKMNDHLDVSEWKWMITGMGLSENEWSLEWVGVKTSGSKNSLFEVGHNLYSSRDEQLITFPHRKTTSHTHHHLCLVPTHILQSNNWLSIENFRKSIYFKSDVFTYLIEQASCLLDINFNLITNTASPTSSLLVNSILII